MIEIECQTCGTLCFDEGGVLKPVENPQDAHLTAAASDLLAALVHVIPEIATCCSEETLEQCREAIKKARGQ